MIPHRCSKCKSWTTDKHDPCSLCNPKRKVRIIEQVTIAPGDIYIVYEE